MSDISLLEIVQTRQLHILDSWSAKRYALNMNFFSSLNPKLFEELKNPPIQYNLYLEGENLNIIDIQNHSFVYPIVKGSHQMIEQNIQLAQNPLNNSLYTLHTNRLALQKLDEQKIPYTAKICNEMIDVMMQEYGGQNRFHLPRHFLPNMTLFGLLGGMFLEFLIEEGYFFHSLLLFEQELDLFRISLYFVNYPKLFEQVSERSCYVFVKDLLHKELVQNYFTHKKITNNFLRLELQLYDSPKIDRVREHIAESYAINARGWGSFDDEMIGVRNTFTNLGNDTHKLKYPILHQPQRLNIPICVVGNGASLDSLLPFIKANLCKMIVFSCGTALKPLKNAGIEPDFHIEIERIDYLKDVLESAPLGDTTLLCGNMVQPSAIEISKEAYIFMRGGSASSYFGKPRSVIEFAAPYVGNAGFALACLLSEEVIVCGLDCGYIKGKTKHAKGSFYGEEDSEIPKNAYKVQGNGDYDVYADALFSLSNAMMSRAINVFKPHLVINLGDGAYIQGSKAVKPSAFDLREVDKQKFVKELKNYMNADKESVFVHYPKDAYLSEIIAFKEQIIRALSSPISGKRALFDRIDLIYKISLKQSSQNPFVGVLFEGSISHILHSLMVCALHIPRDDISGFYQRCVECIMLGLNQMTMNYRIVSLGIGNQ